MQQLSKMTGWNEPERVEVSGDTLSRYIIELRKEPIFGGRRVIDLERPQAENLNALGSLQSLRRIRQLLDLAHGFGPSLTKCATGGLFLQSHFR
jgi:hypothetical protein